MKKFLPIILTVIVAFAMSSVVSAANHKILSKKGPHQLTAPNAINKIHAVRPNLQQIRVIGTAVWLDHARSRVVIEGKKKKIHTKLKSVNDPDPN